jgi:hypothetical protein
MNGGAVNDDRSPENEAMDFKKAVQEPLFCADTPPPSFSQEDMSCVGDRGVQGIGFRRSWMCCMIPASSLCYGRRFELMINTILDNELIYMKNGTTFESSINKSQSCTHGAEQGIFAPRSLGDVIANESSASLAKNQVPET